VIDAVLGQLETALTPRQREQPPRRQRHHLREWGRALEHSRLHVETLLSRISAEVATVVAGQGGARCDAARSGAETRHHSEARAAVATAVGRWERITLFSTFVHDVCADGEAVPCGVVASLLASLEAQVSSVRSPPRHVASQPRR